MEAAVIHPTAARTSAQRAIQSTAARQSVQRTTDPRASASPER